ncbi:hypothetical protein [Pseudomonas fontis]|uniref:DUF4123 domain-containing protein n=1 Tax=Pseudomonas fontis TaxID=2942633 RepID=A0ABT5NPV7_9PSED|nr:hypothetical protein [Pseudomonas fontis]MDD0974698.1 hypothetical protein [Pseudomonas fontis]MDD0990193.1 hypothetical protein [Pseudomonas fontis]
MNLDTLLQFITDQHGPGDYCYALLDPLAMAERSPRALAKTLRDTLGQDAVTPVLRPDLAHAPQHRPLLACLAAPGASPSRSLLELTARAAQADVRQRKRQVCGWLISEQPAEVIAAHLSQMGHLPTAAGGTKYYPVFEPVRLELLAAAFERSDLGPWWPIRHWLFTTSGGATATLHGQPNKRPATPPQASRLQDDVPLVQALLSAWRELLMYPGLYAPERWQGPSVLPPVAAIQAGRLIQQARELGLSTTADLLSLSLHRLSLHPRLHTQPQVAAMLARASAGQSPLDAQLSQYNEARWQAVVASLTQPEYQP